MARKLINHGIDVSHKEKIQESATVPLGTSGVSLVPPCWVCVSVGLCFHFGSVCLWVCLCVGLSVCGSVCLWVFSLLELFLLGGHRSVSAQVLREFPNEPNRYLKEVHETFFEGQTKS